MKPMTFKYAYGKGNVDVVVETRHEYQPTFDILSRPWDFRLARLNRPARWMNNREKLQWQLPYDCGVNIVMPKKEEPEAWKVGLEPSYQHMSAYRIKHAYWYVHLDMTGLSEDDVIRFNQHDFFLEQRKIWKRFSLPYAIHMVESLGGRVEQA